jgi:DNA-binding NarL/FixJ family response regulator
MTISILIADDHAIVAEGLRSLIGTQPEMSVVGLARNGYEAVALARDTSPELVIMDSAMPELNGIEATRLMRRECPARRVLMLSMHSNSAHVHRALEAGVGGYVLKESLGRELFEAIRAVHAGRRYLSKPLADGLLERFMSDRPEDPLSLLSMRERQVLQLLAEGVTVLEIAEKLSLSRKTIETYRERMMQKLDLHDLAGAIKFAIRNELVFVD